jgi:hypothetical protein
VGLAVQVVRSRSEWCVGFNKRTNIEEGLQKTEKYLPELTDWVLWTRRTLTTEDQDWFNRLSSKMRLHLWTGDEVDNLLSGQAAVLRSTYFGELVLILRLSESATSSRRIGSWSMAA